MSIKEKLKAAFAHKHDWKEDQWGKRCQTCGAIRTKKAKRFSEQVAAGMDWFLWSVQLGLAIAGLILAIRYPVSEAAVTHARDQAMAILGPTYWIFLYLFGATGIMVLRHLLKRGVSESH